MKRRYASPVALLLFLLSGIAGCGGEHAATEPTAAPTPAVAVPLTADNFRNLALPAEALDEIFKIEPRKLFIDEGASAAGAPALQAYRDFGLAATMSYKYHLRRKDTETKYSVLVNLYRSPAEAVAGWSRRYGGIDAAVQTPLELADQGLAIPHRVRAFRDGPVLVEIQGAGDEAQADRLARQFAAHVHARRLSRNRGD